jgi:sugar phosphate isomerase/epimerase
MIQAGLLSVTFRKLSPEEIVALVKQAKISSLEWGGDIHVPHGDVARAAQVRQLTEQAGLRVSAYGSYYKAGESEAAGLSFEKVLASAVSLGAPIIRVWAGQRGSATADAAYREKIVQDSQRIGDLAAARQVKIGYEFHGGTLTDTNESALQLLQAVNHAHVTTFWQPAVGVDDAYRLDGLRALLPWLSNVHVYHWRPPHERMPLAVGEEIWKQYFEVIRSSGRNHDASLEFVRNDDPQAFWEDAVALKGLVGL